MLSAYVIPGDWVGNNTPNEQFPYTVHYNQQGVIELGGAIKRDRLWFYGIFPGNRSATTGVGVDPSLERAGGVSYKPFSRPPRASSRTATCRWAGTTTCSAAAPRPAARRRSTPRPWSTATTRSSTPGHPDARQRHPDRGPRRRHLHPRQLHALLERLRDPRPHRSGDRRQLGERAERQQAVPQPHDHRRRDRPFHVRLRTRLPRLLDRRSDRVCQPAPRSGQDRRRQLHRFQRRPYRATYKTAGHRRPHPVLGRLYPGHLDAERPCPLNLGLRYDAIDGDVPELSSDAEIEGTDGSTFSPPVVTYPGVPDLVLYNTSHPGSASRSGSTNRDGRCSSRPTGGLRQARDRDVLRHLAGRSGHGRARVQRDHWRLHDSRQRHRPQAQLRRRFRPGRPVHRSSVGGHRAPDRRRRRDRGVLCLQERSRVRPPAGHPRRLCAPRHRRHLRRCVPDHYRAVAHQRRRLAAVHGGQPRRSRPELQIGRGRVQQRFSDRVQANTLVPWQDSKAFGSGSVSGRPSRTSAACRHRRLLPRPERHAQRLGPPRPTPSMRSSCRRRLSCRGTSSSAGGTPTRPDDPRDDRSSFAAWAPARAMSPPWPTPAAPTRCRRSTTSSSASTSISASAAAPARLRSTCSTSSLRHVLTLRNNSSQVTATTPWQQTLSVVRPRTVQLGPLRVLGEFCSARCAGGTTAPPGSRF